MDQIESPTIAIMDQTPLFVKMALNAWDSNINRATALFNKFTDEELMTEIAPGKNRVIYLLGHLTAVHDQMLPLLDFGARQYPHLDEAFIANPDKKITDIPPAEELRNSWVNINNTLVNHFNRLLPEEWFQRHTKMTDEDLAKEPWRNRLSVLMNRTNHLCTHIGQITLLKK